jgi:hypothetical protein
MIRHAAAVVVALTLSTSPLYAQNAVKMTVNEASASVHKTPSVGSPVIGKAAQGTELTVMREVGDWMKISWPSSVDGAGYVRTSVLSRAGAPTTAKPVATAKVAPAAPAAAKTTTAKAAPAAAGAKTPATTKAAPAPAGTRAAEAPPALVTAKAVAAAPTPAPVAVRNEQLPVPQPSAPSPARTLYVAPSHVFGMGAVAGSTGFGGSARAWKKGRLGIQLEVSRYSYDSVDLLSRASVTDIAPGLLFALNDRVSDSLWVRPYLGLAARYAHSSRTDLIFADASESANTIGARVFLGGEFSLASVPALSLSADVGYYHMPEPFVGFEPSGMGVAISAHWYLK